MENKKAKHVQRLHLKRKSLGRQGAENEASGLVGHMMRTHQEIIFSWNGQAEQAFIQRSCAPPCH